MTPVVILVALIVLFMALKVAADEEDERSLDADPSGPAPRTWWRQLVSASSFVLLLPVGLVFATGGALLAVGGPVWWWLWLGIAGVILIALAATYERQLRLLKGVVRSISDLR